MAVKRSTEYEPQGARPHCERYERASAAANDASAALHHHVLAARREGLIFMPIVELEKRSDALDTWIQWAAGAVIDVDDLGVAVKTLLRVTGRDANQYRALGQVALQWAATTAVELPTRRAAALARHLAGPELGL